MNIHIYACTIAFSVFISFNSAYSQAPGNITDFVNLEICNESSNPISVATFHEHMLDRGEWFLRSWFIAQPNECVRHPRIPKGYFYYFGRSNTGAWRGDKRYICVSPRATFRKVHENEKCMAGEELVGMRERILTNDTEKIRLTDR